MTDTSPSHAALADWAKALAHPARLAILKTLGARGQCVCGEVVEVVGLAQSTVSQHLKVLREAGLITGTADGPRSCYCLDDDALAALSDRFSDFFDGLVPCSCDDDCC
ncbi:ArsR/SmtB family transcription factor [Rubrivirga sp.]|uniref:ArsR/SmtB family transcription factor n=1 Tax=Rubrivirga sp. TaxID=1885344 RepID=UPI003B520FF4